MAKKTPPLTQRSLFYWVLHKNRGSQFVLFAIIVISLFFRVFPLEMQKNIINIAINLKMVDKLFLYCALYFGAVLIAGLLKYFINAFQAILGQKLLITMRQELYEHILQLPLPFFHRTQAGTIISAMTAELNAIGAFLGEAIAVPLTTVLTFIVFAGFMISLNPLLGIISISIYPLELIIIPYMQRKLNKINQTRVTTTRAMANLVNESVTGIHEVQGNASYKLEQIKLDRLIQRLFQIMKKISLLKYGIKFSNNLFQSFGPFLLFLIGGYMAINGEFTLGALVAFLSAYEKVYDPWKDIIVYYQSYQDAHIRYGQIMSAFNVQPEYLLEEPERTPLILDGNISAKNLGYTINGDTQLLSGVTFSLEAGQHLALIGFSGSGKSTLSLLISQLYSYSSGNLTIDGHEIRQMTKKDVAQNVATVAQHPFIFTGTVRDNLLYSCTAAYRNNLISSMPERLEIMRILDKVGIKEDVLRWGLRTIVPQDKARKNKDKLLEMRQIVRSTLHAEFSRAVEFFEPEQYLEYQSLGTNIVFGYFTGPPASISLRKNDIFIEFLKNSGMYDRLIDFGQEIAHATISFLKDMSQDDFFFQGSPMKPKEFVYFVKLIEKIEKDSSIKLKKYEENRLLSLALRYTSSQHKIYTMSPELKRDIIENRKQFLYSVAQVNIPQLMASSDQPFPLNTTSIYEPLQNFTPFDPSQYLFSRSLFENILFGTITDNERIRNTMGKLALEQFAQHGLVEEILDIGLDFHVGSRGDNLSGGQKQKIALARAFLRKPAILILDEATASLDNQSQARIQRYIDTELKGNTTVIAVVHRLDMIAEYDHIVVMKEGQLIEAGTYDELLEKQGTLYELINSK